MTIDEKKYLKSFGVDFCIPLEEIRKILDENESYEQARRALIGFAFPPERKRRPGRAERSEISGVRFSKLGGN